MRTSFILAETLKSLLSLYKRYRLEKPFYKTHLKPQIASKPENGTKCSNHDIYLMQPTTSLPPLATKGIAKMLFQLVRYLKHLNTRPISWKTTKPNNETSSVFCQSATRFAYNTFPLAHNLAFANPHFLNWHNLRRTLLLSIKRSLFWEKNAT